MEMSHTSARIRPLNLRDLLDELFRIFRSKFTTIMSASLAVDVPLLFIQLILSIVTSLTTSQMLLDPTTPPSSAMLGMLGASLFSYLISFIRSFFTLPLLQASIVHISMHDLLDRPIGLKQALKLGLGNVLQIVLATLLISIATLIVFLPFMCVFFFVIFSSVSASGSILDGTPGQAIGFVIVSVGVMLLLLLGVALLLMPFVLYLPVICTERANAIDAFKRSWNLVKGSYWRVVGYLAVIAILGGLLIYIPSIVIIAAGYLVLDSTNPWLQPLTVFATTIGQLFYIPITIIAYTLLYTDLRVRKEGYDMELSLQTPSQA